MAKYRVIRDCYGFQGRYWHRDSVVNLDAGANPPEHFLPLEEVKKVVEDKAVEPAAPVTEQPKEAPRLSTKEEKRKRSK